MSKKAARSAFHPSPTHLDYLNVSGSVTINGWEVGYLGNAEFMVFLPSDLILNTAPSTPLDQMNHVEIGFSDDTGGSKQFPVQPTFGYFGSAVVPPGFRAVSAICHGTPAGGTWRAYMGEWDTGIPLTVTAVISINDTSDFGTPIEGLQYVSLQWIPNDPASLFHGAQIFLEQV